MFCLRVMSSKPRRGAFVVSNVNALPLLLLLSLLFHTKLTALRPHNLPICACGCGPFYRMTTTTTNSNIASFPIAAQKHILLGKMEARFKAQITKLPGSFHRTRETIQGSVICRLREELLYTFYSSLYFCRSSLELSEISGPCCLS